MPWDIIFVCLTVFVCVLLIGYLLHLNEVENNTCPKSENGHDWTLIDRRNGGFVHSVYCIYQCTHCEKCKGEYL